MKPRVLLTGATGFMGKYLLSRLLQEQYPVTVLARRTSNLALLNAHRDQINLLFTDEITSADAFARQEVGIVIHCATNYGRNALPPTQVVEANLHFPLQLLQLLVESGLPAPTFINTDTILDKRVNYYSLSKKQFVEWLQLFQPQLCSVNIALEHFYGPGDNATKFAIDIIRKLLRGDAEIQLTPGEQKRDFIYIDDVITAFMQILHWSASAGTGYHYFEVGSGQTTSIREFVTLAQTLAGNHTTHLNFGALPYRPNEVMATQVNTDALCGLGWQPTISLEEGLRRTIDFEKRHASA